MRKSSADVWMLATYPTWSGEAYAARMLGELGALEDRGVRVGMIRIIPASVWRDRRRVETRRRMRSSGRPTMDILQPPDRGVGALRRIQTIYLRQRLRSAAKVHGIRLVHAQGMRAGSLAALLPNTVRLVVDVHGDVVAEAVLSSVSAAGGRKRIAWAVDDAAQGMQRSDALVAVSPNMARWLQTLPTFKPGTQVVMVPCGVDLGRFTEAGARLPTGATGSLRVLYLGGLQAYQPPRLIAKACQQLYLSLPGTVEFKVVTPTRHGEVYQEFAELGLRVSVHSARSDEVSKIMAQADLGIVPRIENPVNWVSCPTKIGEYLAAGVPVACSPHVGGWAEELTEQGVGVSLDDHLAVQQLVGLIRSDRSTIAERCRGVAASYWDWAQLADGIVKSYGIEREEGRSCD